MPKRKPHTRIIGGVHKGTKIPYKPSETIRPTESRARETLFNWLMHDTEGAICLDMFSGTGALGIEALSRGADKVIFLEKNKDLCLIINNLLEQLSLTQKAEVIHTDSLKYPLEKLNLIFDIVFLDPPYRKDFLNNVYNKFDKTTLLREIIATTHKNTVVVAPTGIAALNAGGVTIHSMFQLPFGGFIPDNSTPQFLENSKFFKLSIFSFNCFKLLTPIKAEVTALLFNVHARAI